MRKAYARRIINLGWYQNLVDFGDLVWDEEYDGSNYFKEAIQAQTSRDQKVISIPRSSSYSNREPKKLGSHRAKISSKSTLSEIFASSQSTAWMKPKKNPGEDVQATYSYDKMNFDKPPELGNIDIYFKNQLFERVSVCDLEKRRVSLQEKTSYCKSVEKFDKSELTFCKNMLAVSNKIQSLGSDANPDTCFSDVVLQSKLIDVATITDSSLRMAAARKKALEVKKKEIEARQQWLKNAGTDQMKKRFAEAVFKNKRVFQVENILMLKKRMEKDPQVGAGILKNVDQFKQSVEKLNPNELNRQTQEVV